MQLGGLLSISPPCKSPRSTVGNRRLGEIDLFLWSHFYDYLQVFRECFYVSLLYLWCYVCSASLLEFRLVAFPSPLGCPQDCIT